MRVVPVNQSVGPLVEGFEPVRAISIFMVEFGVGIERVAGCARRTAGNATATPVAVFKNLRRGSD
jgi:hypothetical protein